MLYWDPDGLRIHVGNLNNEELEIIISELAAITGLSESDFITVEGFLGVADEAVRQGGSEIAFHKLVQFINDPRVVALVPVRGESRRRLAKARASNLRQNNTLEDPTGHLESIGFDFDDFAPDLSEITLTNRGKKLKKKRKSGDPTIESLIIESSRLGLTLFHELSHSFDGTLDPPRSSPNARGPAVDFVNTIRKQLGLPLRGIYHPQRLSIFPANENFTRSKIPFAWDQEDLNEGKYVGHLIEDASLLAPDSLIQLLTEVLANNQELTPQDREAIRTVILRLRGE